MRDIDFDEVTFAVPDETANDSSGVDDGSAQACMMALLTRD